MPSVPNLRPDPQLPDFRWNQAAGRYVNPRGQFVSADTIRAQLDKAIDGVADSMAAVSERLRTGAISISEWQTEMMALSKDANLLGGALERGGWQHMSQADFGRVGRVVRDEYGYLRDFARQIETGAQPLDGTLARRARLYGQQGRSTYYQFTQVDARRRGFDEVSSVTTPADHCPECVALEDSWYNLQTREKVSGSGPDRYVSVGSRQCRSNCKCYERYRNSETGEVKQA